MTGTRRRPGLDQVAEGERRSSTRRSGSAPATLGGSNRLMAASISVGSQAGVGAVHQDLPCGAGAPARCQQRASAISAMPSDATTGWRKK